MNDGGPASEPGPSVDTALGPVPVAPRGCPACDAANEGIAGNRYSRPPWAIKDCPACGFVYLDPAPRYEALNETLSWDLGRAAETQRRAAARPLSHRLSQATRKRNRVLPRHDIVRMVERHAAPGNAIDIGCADGGRISKIGPDFTPFGIEIAAGLAREAEARLAPRGGGCVHAPASTGLAAFADGFFAAAVLRSYLEHEVAPRAVLAELVRALAPGGIAVVKVPNYASLNRRFAGRAWCGFRFPEHVNYFTPASLARMARGAGFDARFGPLGMLPLSDNMWALLRRP